MVCATGSVFSNGLGLGCTDLGHIEIDHVVSDFENFEPQRGWFSTSERCVFYFTEVGFSVTVAFYMRILDLSEVVPLLIFVARCRIKFPSSGGSVHEYSYCL